MAEKRKAVIVVDDHVVVREGLARLLDGVGELFVAGQASGAEEATALAVKIKPDVALVDVRLADGDGIALAARLKRLVPDIKIIVLTAYSTPHLAETALAAGVDGVLLKTIDGAAIVTAVNEALAGRTILDPVLLPKVLEGLREGSPEAAAAKSGERLLELLAKGLTNKEIGIELRVSEKTVRNRLSLLYKRLGIGNRTEAALYHLGTYVPRRKD